MSQENVELAYRAFDAFNRHDLDALLALFDPEVEFTTRFMEMEGDLAYHGHDGVRQWWGDLHAIFPDYSAEVLEVRDSGDLVIFAWRARAHGRDSAAPVEQALWLVSQWRDGKVVRWRTFGSQSEALEAAGLSE